MKTRSDILTRDRNILKHKRLLKALFWDRKGRDVTKVKGHKTKATDPEAKAKVKAARKAPV